MGARLTKLTIRVKFSEVISMKELVEKLIKQLEERIERNNDCEDVFFDGQSSAFEWTISVINKLVEECNNGWIPCSERLPKIFEDTKSSEVVLICGYDKQNDYYWQAMGFYVKTESLKRWFFADCKNTDKPIDWIDIVAWQPLPEPYKITV